MRPSWSLTWKNLGQRTEQSPKMRTGIGQREREREESEWEVYSLVPCTQCLTDDFGMDFEPLAILRLAVVLCAVFSYSLILFFQLFLQNLVHSLPKRYQGKLCEDDHKVLTTQTGRVSTMGGAS